MVSESKQRLSFRWSPTSKQSLSEAFISYMGTLRIEMDILRLEKEIDGMYSLPLRIVVPKRSTVSTTLPSL